MSVYLFLLGLLVGCATSRIDWSSRVGHYTFDQAVLDFGPPDKQAKLTDNSVVAEWLTQRGYSQIRYLGGWGYGTTVDRSPDYYLRLNFSPDGQLTAWKKFAK